MELLDDFEDAYENMAEALSLPSLDDLDAVFEVRDAVLHEGFISTNPLRFVRRRIVQFGDNWTGYLHSVILPGDQNLVLYEESGKFSDEEKDEAMKLISRIMRLSRRSTLLELDHDDTADSSFITEALKEWQELLRSIRPFVERSLSAWQE